MGGYRRHFYREDIAGPTWLYKLFHNSTLLYVGVSSAPRSRFKTHRQKKDWWAAVNRVEYVWFPSRAEAFKAEREAISLEQPLHNIARPKGAAA